MPDHDSRQQVRSAWRTFLLEWQLAMHYSQTYALYIGRTHRNPLLDRLLPALLHIRACAVLDEALETLLRENDIRLPNPPLRNDLFGRISALEQRGIVSTEHQLHAVRERRNALAHDEGATCTTEELEQDIARVESALEQTGFVDARPTLEFFAERSAMEESTDPEIAFVQHFKAGIKENDRPAIEIAWSEQMHRNQ